MIASTAPELRVFVSAPYDARLAALLGALRRAGIDAFVSSDVAPLGASVVEGARSAIEKADLVLVVLTKRAAPNALFEAGMAAGLGKRLLIVAESDAPVPVDLSGVLTVRAARDDPAPAVAAVQEIARHAGAVDRQSPRATGHALDASIGRRLLDRARSRSINERDALEVLLEAINATGAVAVEATNPDEGWDIGVWADDLTSIGGNPLVVEVKRHLVARTVDELRDRLAAQGNARLGLVVYLAHSSGRARRRGVPEAWFPVLVVSLRDLVEQLQSMSFASVVRDLRNRAVHGHPRG
jgi:hypothetical protein